MRSSSFAELSLASERQTTKMIASPCHETSHRLAQIEDAVLASIRPREERRSLAAEWIDLLRVRPIFASGLALARSAALLLLSPTSGILAMLLQ